MNKINFDTESKDHLIKTINEIMDAQKETYETSDCAYEQYEALLLYSLLDDKLLDLV